MIKKTIITLLAVFIVLATLAQNTANRFNDTILIEETIVKAYRAEHQTPISFTNLSSKTINKLNQGQEPAQILSNSPSVHAYSDAGNFRGYSYFRIRGIDQTRINMSLDGIPLNEPEDQGVYFSNYPDFFNSVDRLQIQRGVGTSANGVASYAGSINFSSAKLYDKQEVEVGLDYGSYNTSRAYGEFRSGITNNKAFYIRTSSLRSDGYKRRSANESYSTSLGGGWFSGAHSFKLIGFIGNQKNEMAWLGVPLADIKKDRRSNDNSIEDDDFSQSLVGLQYSYSLSENVMLNSCIYYNYLKGNYDFDFNNYFNYPEPEELFNYAFEHNFMGTFTNLNINWDKTDLAVGVHANTFKRSHTGSLNRARQYQNTGYKNEFSAFAKVQHQFFGLNLFADVQFRHSSFDYEGSVGFERMNWNFVNYRFGANYRFLSLLDVYYSFGTTSREPTRNDIFGGWDNLNLDKNGKPMFFVIDPEEVFDHEVGVRAQTDGWHFALNAYFMDFNNEIVLNGQFGPNGLALHSNVAESYRRGVEFDYAWKPLTFLYLSGNLNYSWNKIKEGEIEIEPILTPVSMMNQELEFSFAGVELNLRGRFQDRSFIDFGNQHELPSFFCLDTRISYRFKKWQMHLGANNVLDEDILSNGSMSDAGVPLYFVQAPRNYFIGVKWKL